MSLCNLDSEEERETRVSCMGATTEAVSDVEATPTQNDSVPSPPFSVYALRRATGLSEKKKKKETSFTACKHRDCLLLEFVA